MICETPKSPIEKYAAILGKIRKPCYELMVANHTRFPAQREASITALEMLYKNRRAKNFLFESPVTH
jgi:hypothetical protein